MHSPPHLFIDPAIEQNPLNCLSPAPFPLSRREVGDLHSIIVGENGTILSDYVKQVDATDFNGFADMVIR